VRRELCPYCGAGHNSGSIPDGTPVRCRKCTLPYFLPGVAVVDARTIRKLKCARYVYAHGSAARTFDEYGYPIASPRHGNARRWRRKWANAVGRWKARIEQRALKLAPYWRY
jgi:hypothetical protein